jgi:hypothetical protein
MFIASHIRNAQHLVSWLGVAPLTSARMMHDAAFYSLFSGVLLMFGANDSPGPVIEKLHRISARKEWSSSVTHIKVAFETSRELLSNGEVLRVDFGQQISSGMYHYDLETSA